MSRFQDCQFEGSIQQHEYDSSLSPSKLRQDAEANLRVLHRERERISEELDREAAVFVALPNVTDRQLRRFNMVYTLLYVQINTQMENAYHALQQRLWSMAVSQRLSSSRAHDEDTRPTMIADTEGKVVAETIRLIGKGLEAMRELNGRSSKCRQQWMRTPPPPPSVNGSREQCRQDDVADDASPRVRATQRITHTKGPLMMHYHDQAGVLPRKSEAMDRERPVNRAVDRATFLLANAPEPSTSQQGKEEDDRQADGIYDDDGVVSASLLLTAVRGGTRGHSVSSESESGATSKHRIEHVERPGEMRHGVQKNKSSAQSWSRDGQDGREEDGETPGEWAGGRRDHESIMSHPSVYRSPQSSGFAPCSTVSGVRDTGDVSLSGGSPSFHLPPPVDFVRKRILTEAQSRREEAAVPWGYESGGVAHSKIYTRDIDADTATGRKRRRLAFDSARRFD